MSHMGPEVLRRILRGEGTAREADAATQHVVSCDSCRALAGTLIDELRVERPEPEAKGPLRLVFDLIDRERQWGVESLAAISEWAELRHLSRRGRRDRVRMTKACHTIAFVNLALNELKEEAVWEEAEFLAGLALLAIEAMVQRRQITEASSNDLQAEVWTEVGNARRRAAEWKKAHQALGTAEKYVKVGAGDRRLEARLLSITASTLADEGHISQALEALEKSRSIYDALSEWGLLARTLVKTANILAGIEPTKGLLALDHAAPLIPVGDSHLMLLAELLRVECLIEVEKPGEALHVFRRCSGLLLASTQLRMRIRGRFTGARLLAALGFHPQAERLFDEVIDRDIEHELYKDAFLDLLYLYEHHMKAGDLEKAARVCRRALTDSALAAIAHDQLREVWNQLLEATQRQAFSQEGLRELRRYLSAHWKHPAETRPAKTFSPAAHPERESS